MQQSSIVIPKVQRAWRSVRRGPPAKSLELQTDAPVATELKDGEVLIKVEAGALNPVGHKMMKLMPNYLAKRPHIAEFDLAGEIVDERGSQFAKGDKVIAYCPVPLSFKTGQGALAQYSRIPAKNVLKRPDGMSATDAAGFPLAGMTAYLSLMGLAKLESGQSVFVNGGSTAVGAFAIQIAKAKGCKVDASCSAKNFERVKAFGAENVFDYTTSPLYGQLTAKPPTPKYHVFFECVGIAEADLYIYSKAYLAPNGVFISVMPQPSSFSTLFSAARHLFEGLYRPRWLGGMQPRWVLARSDAKQPFYGEFHQLIMEGKVKPYVDSVFEFEDALKAYDRMMSKRATGKVVVKISH